MSTVPPKAALSNSGVQTDEKLLFNTSAQTDPVFGLQPIPSIVAPSFQFILGRQPRQVPVGDVGAFQAPVSYTPTLGSFATKSGLAHVPLLDKNKALVPSKTPKLPVVPSKSLVSAF